MSDYDSESSNDLSGSSSETPIFQKKVVFKKTPKKNTNIINENDSKNIKDIAVSNINKNLKRLEQQQLHENSLSSLVFDERILYVNIDDTDKPNDEVEFSNWKKRELNRLHRDRNRRIQREENSNN